MRAALFTVLLLLTAARPAAVVAATLEGQVVHRTAEDEPAADVDLTGLTIRLVWRQADGELTSRETQTESGGAFRFADLEVPGRYLASAEYQDIVFPFEQVEFTPSETSATRSLRLDVYDRSPEAGGLESSLSIMQIEPLDAGAYRVLQRLVIDNPTSRVIAREESEEPALEIGVLGNREDEIVASLLFAPAEIELDANVAKYRGPIFPGKQPLDLFYDVDGGGSGFRSEIYFPEDTPNFELRLRDTGVIVDAAPLHVARREVAEGGAYLRFLGYDIPAGTRIPIAVTPLPPRSDSTGAAAAILALLFGGLLIFVGLPVVEAPGGGLASAAAGTPAGGTGSENEALFEALADLEHDFEMGKISAEDRDRLRRELRKDALDEMARRRQLKTSLRSASDPDPSRTCSCGRRAGPDDRFCAACGSAL